MVPRRRCRGAVNTFGGLGCDAKMRMFMGRDMRGKPVPTRHAASGIDDHRFDIPHQWDAEKLHDTILAGASSEVG